MINNPMMVILLENAMTFADRNKVYGLMESEQAQVNNTMISNLYKSALEKSHINFEDIPISAGDITRYSGYKSMMSSIALLRDIATKSNITISELDIVDKSISNITAYRDAFEKGFKLEKEFIILQYNLLVCACVEAISSIISSYVDYIKRPDRIEFTIIKNTKQTGWICIQNLDKFNGCVKSGDFSKAINGVINSGKESVIGIDDIIVPTLIIGGVLVLVPIIRELIFYFYHSRMRMSDYLKQQAAFIELNKNSIGIAALPANKKSAVIKKQSEVIRQLQSISDKIRVNHTTSESKSMDELNKENRGWTINDVATQSESSDGNGFKLL